MQPGLKIYCVVIKQHLIFLQGYGVKMSPNPDTSQEKTCFKVSPKA